MKYNVLQKFEATVNTIKNPYNFEQQQLFNMALRINKKRRFLFVSQVLGKHLAVDPTIPILTSHLLAYQFMEQRYGYVSSFAKTIGKAIQTKQNLKSVLLQSREKKITPKNALTVIGFAETATALGHSFFEKFDGDVHFVHTTREHIVDVEPTITFEEEHSHASSHRVYAQEDIFLRNAEVVLVDDEMTTGKTNRNIIKQLQSKYPHLTTFTLISILDFRSLQAQEEMRQLANELGITIYCVSLFTGAFQINETEELFDEVNVEVSALKSRVNEFSFEHLLKDVLIEKSSFSESHTIKTANYFRDSGRFALSVDNQKSLETHVVQVAEVLQQKRSAGPCLVLGTGEFMYVPMSIAVHMGDHVKYHATTRSPIYSHENSLIYNKFTFPSSEIPGVTNYLYNIPMGVYEDIFVIYERIVDSEAAEILHAQLLPYANNIHFITLGGVSDVVYT